MSLSHINLIEVAYFQQILFYVKYFSINIISYVFKFFDLYSFLHFAIIYF